MKKLLSLIILFTAFSLAAYCQEEPEKKHQDFHFIEAGIGVGLIDSHNDPLVFNLGLANSFGKHLANFLDYNMYFDKSGANRHEFSFKVGPYLRIDKYSYLAISSGFSLLVKSSNSSSVYQNGMFVYEDPYQLNVPVQVKVNTSLCKGLCIGMKATYNKMVQKDDSNKASVLLFLALGW